MKKIFLLSLIAVVAALQSCHDLDLVPTDRETEATFWDKPEDAFNVLNTVYENMYSAEYFFYNETLSDNAFNKSEVDGSNSRNIAEGSYDPSHRRITDEWGYHYSGIRKCNILLANIDKVPGLSDELRNRMKGEARFIRAFHYFHLTVWYQDVPQIEHVLSVEESLNLERATQAEIVTFIKNDLDFAATSLPVNTAYNAADRGRITKGAALALKAKLMLYLEEWDEVISIAEKFFTGEAGSYALFGDYAGLFKPVNEYNAEVILDLQFVPVQRTHDIQRFFIPKTEGKLVTSIAPTQELVDSYLTINGLPIDAPGANYDEDDPYSNRDPRLQATIVYHGYTWTRGDGSTVVIETLPGPGANSIDRDDATPTGYYFAKYFDPTADADNRSGLNLMLIRYAEILLMYAEAKFEKDQFDASVWDNTLRIIRQRAGFTAASALDYDSDWDAATLEQILQNEWRTEFAMEGQRIFNIRRWRIAEDVLNTWAHGIRIGDPAVDNGYKRVDLRSFDPSKHYLWPVPQRERDLNKKLSQNENW